MSGKVAPVYVEPGCLHRARERAKQRTRTSNEQRGENVVRWVSLAFSEDSLVSFRVSIINKRVLSVSIGMLV